MVMLADRRDTEAFTELQLQCIPDPPDAVATVGQGIHATGLDLRERLSHASEQNGGFGSTAQVALLPTTGQQRSELLFPGSAHQKQAHAPGSTTFVS